MKTTYPRPPRGSYAQQKAAHRAAARTLKRRPKKGMTFQKVASPNPKDKVIDNPMIRGDGRLDNVMGEKKTAAQLGRPKRRNIKLRGNKRVVARIPTNGSAK